MLFGRLGDLGYLLTFISAVPGFAYGYYQPQGKPLEYWLMVQWRYFTSPQQWGAGPPIKLADRLREARQHVHSLWRAGSYLLLRRLAQRKERKPRAR